jgi:hypothetical protein
MPKGGRRTKKMVGLPFVKFKLMATYSYGYGFTPFLVHDSQTMGGNLLWTVLWLTITAQAKAYGYLPSELHLQLDNTSSENKNDEMRGMCAWLVATFKFRRVRVFFLLVGHTHVIIDQIFGVITTHIRTRYLLVPSVLTAAIDLVMLKNPQYQAKPVRILHALWDFDHFIKRDIGVNKLGGLCERQNYIEFFER